MMAAAVFLLTGLANAVGYGLEVALHHPRHLSTALTTFFALSVTQVALWMSLLFVAYAALNGPESTAFLSVAQLLTATWPLAFGFARVMPLLGPGLHTATRALAIGTVALALSAGAATALATALALSLLTFLSAYLLTWTLYALVNRATGFRETRWSL